jgi:hypothetical protein
VSPEFGGPPRKEFILFCAVITQKSSGNQINSGVKSPPLPDSGRRRRRLVADPLRMLWMCPQFIHLNSGGARLYGGK